VSTFDDVVDSFEKKEESMKWYATLLGSVEVYIVRDDDGAQAILATSFKDALDTWNAWCADASDLSETEVEPDSVERLIVENVVMTEAAEDRMTLRHAPS
jgi:hypothetical protein